MATQRTSDAPPGRGPTPPASLEEALARARLHGRNAASETLAMLQALVDAAALAASGRPAGAHPGIASVARTLEGWSSRLAGEAHPGLLLNALSDALDLEIARWQERARGDDTDARAVLRAFLGIRELLWELGVRSPERPAERPGRRGSQGRGAPPRRGPRVQRVPVEG